MQNIILFEGKKTKKYVSEWKGDLYIQTFVYIDMLGQLGVLARMFYDMATTEELTSAFWGPIHRDLITAWRATLILDECKHFGAPDLSAAYYAAQHNVEPHDLEYANAIKARIGAGVHYEIMNTAIPTSLMDVFFALIEDDFELYLPTITDEVRAGNLEWQDRFKLLGIRHPNDIDDAQKAVLVRYESHIQSYMKTFRADPTQLTTNLIVNKILEAIGKGIESQYGKDFSIGLALVHSYISANPSLTKTEVESIIKQIAIWLQLEFATGFWPFQTWRKWEDYQHTLTLLENEFASMPTAHSLMYPER